jgi:hypothetical protein
MKRVTLREDCVNIGVYLSEIPLFTLTCCGLVETIFQSSRWNHGVRNSSSNQIHEPKLLVFESNLVITGFKDYYLDLPKN